MATFLCIQGCIPKFGSISYPHLRQVGKCFVAKMTAKDVTTISYGHLLSE